VTWLVAEDRLQHPQLDLTRVRVPSGTRTVWNAQNSAGFQVFLEDAGLLDLSM
jgi:hypothetical protein